MRKARKIDLGGKEHIQFYCPGCKTTHAVDGRWSFNGDLCNPTFSPSLDWTGGRYNDDESYTKLHCHSFIKNGKIQFLSDCSHELAGQTVELPEVKL